MNFIAKAPSTFSSPASQSPGEKMYGSQSSWSAKIEEDDKRGNPLSTVTQVTRQGTTTNNFLKARTQHATQDGMMTKLGLLKSGKLMNWWMMERGHPKATTIHHWRLRKRIGILVRIQIFFGYGE